MDLRAQALQALILNEPAAKLAAVHALQAANASQAPVDTHQSLVATGPLPGRPARPRLVRPAQVPRRSVATREGRAALLHAVAHIEMNAVNLALDAAWRFADMPDRYYRDWLVVAAEEATHFALLREHLQTLGHEYGDFDGHDGLWEMVEKTRDDVTARMALVPRTLEARGLDATPPMQHKLAQAGDARAVAILDIILRDEVGHVAIGNHWYRWCCERDGVEPVAHYAMLVERYGAPRLKGPFNLEARERAGFTPEELALLAQTAGQQNACRESGHGDGSST